ncbi:MAG: hypothetical protein RIR70_604 [Pseudomonadota bacterium]|jgi:phospho-N-acetylmuramoyl-pentapeptide-transferase
MVWLMLAVGAVVSFGVIAWMLRSGRVGAIDLPNERSLHTHAVPRSGGLGVLAGLSWVFFVHFPIFWPLAVAIMAVAAVSWLDDRHPLPARVRFATHLLAAIWLAGCGVFFEAPWWVMGLMVLGVVWLTNLYNFMDGSDGLAGGMALFGFGAYGLAAWLAGSLPMAALCLAVAGAAAGFLVFNFHPARIFMGDVGAIPLGFLAGALGLMGVRDGLWHLPFMLLVFSPFIMDASVTLARRAWRRETLWQAHREHYYQRLIQSGWGHARTAWAVYMLMLAVAACAVSARTAPLNVWVGILLGWAGVYALLGSLIDRRWRNHQNLGR